jgi:MFS transporter, PAT family, beta-lactamase induction signal transducer AmpG
MSLAERRGLRLFTLCVMYVAQGIPWAFTAITLPAYLSADGVSDEALGGVLAMTTLPYSFKWVWGVVIDAFPSRRFGRRRPWIVFAQGMLAASIGAMILIPDLTASVRLLAFMVFINTVFSSIQDVAVDALAVDLLDEAERGRANGLMYASKYVGGAIGGTGLSHVIGWTSLRGALIVQTVILGAIMLLPLFVRERPVETEPKRPPFWRGVLAWAKRTFDGRKVGSVIWQHRTALRSALLVVLVMLISNLATALLSAIGNGLFTRKLGWDPETYASLTGGWALVAGGLGATMGGYLADRVGHRLLAGSAALVLAGYYVFWSQSEAHWASHTFVYCVFWIEPLLVGMMTASLFALCMDVTWKAVAASQFAIYMAFSNLSSTLAYSHAGDATSHWSYTTIYLIAAAIQASLVLVLPLVNPKAANAASSAA